MSLPKQVRDQIDRANQITEELTRKPDDPQEPAPVEPIQPTEEQTIQPPVEPDVTTPAEPAPASPAEPPAKRDDPNLWKHKYDTLQGIFNAQGREWQQERKALIAEVQALKQEVQARQAAPEPTAPVAVKGKVTDQDLETYGPELIDLIGRKAAEQADQIVAARMQELQPLLNQTQQRVDNVATQVYRNNEERYWGELEKAVPEFRDIDQDQRWLDWLAETDPLSGVQRQSYLNDAHGKLDHVRVAALFNAFKGTVAPAKPAESAAPTRAKAAPSPSPRTVGNASAPTPRDPEDGKSVSRTEIAAHYRRSATDAAYRTGPDGKAMEERIAAAMAANRIREA